MRLAMLAIAWLGLLLCGCADTAPRPTAAAEPTGTWQEPGVSGTSTVPVPGGPTVAPVGPSGNSAECREFQQTITIAGQTHKAFGTACRQADGTWKIVP